MADYYVDHGAYASTLGNTPTWGTPQEGDGSSKDAATAASVGSFLFGAGQPANNETVAICGVTFTAKTSGATGNQFNIGGTVGVTMDNLAAAINASTTAVGTTVATGAPQLRNLVYARGPSSGAAANTCEIMMRVGSTTLNYSINANVALAHACANAPTLTQFAGGSGGCWGWLLNTSAIGVSSSIAVITYGLMVSKPIVWTATPTQNDFIYVRTGSGVTLSQPSGSGFSRGNVGFPMNLVFDTNTKWTGDSGTGVVTLGITSPASGYGYFRPNNSGVLGNEVSYWCMAKGNLTISCNSSASACYTNLFENTYAFSGYGLKIVESAAPHSSANVRIPLTLPGHLRLLGCEIDFSTYPRTNLSNGPYISHGSSAGGLLELDDVDFKTYLTGVPADAYPLFPSITLNGASSYGASIKVTNSRFSTNSSYKLKLFTSTAGGIDNFASIVVQNNSGLALDAAALGIQKAFDYSRPQHMNTFLFIGEDTNRHQRYEQRHGVVEWNPSASPAFPTLAAQLPDGTAYAMKMSWLSTSAMNIAEPFSYRSSQHNRLATGTRTIVQHLFYDSTRGFDKKTLGIIVSYVDSTGKPRTERTHFSQDPAASGATWVNAGSYANFVAYKLTVTTAYSVKQYTDIKVDVVLIGNPPGSGNTDVYVDPEFSVT